MDAPHQTHPREREIFLEAVEIEAAVDRAAYLDQACGEDAHLRERVEALLAVSQTESLVVPRELPTVVLPQSTPTMPERLLVRGDKVNYFGDYELLDKIASGGMGVVWRARQVSLKREVALKMIRSALLASEAEVQRFRVEAEAAAGLDHPNIVPIYEIGEQEGQHFFSMRLIEGGTLSDHQDRLQKDHRAAVALMITVARAMDAAHRAGILHRDLKPGNILMDEAGEPHITDFGLAKNVHDPELGLTMTGQVMGTPYYMAPEQARGDSRRVSTAADTYSLGAILFELLSGKKMFPGTSVMSILQKVISEPPPLLRTVDASIDRDLETIVAKCLEKKPELRYLSCADLADDLNRWLRGEPIQARPVGPGERLVKWTKRKPLHAALAGLGAAFVLMLAVGGPLVALKQNELRQVADQSANDARRALGKAQIALAEAAFAANDDQRMISYLKECPTEVRDTNWEYLNVRANDFVRDNEKALIRGVAADPTAPGMFYLLDQEGPHVRLDGQTSVQKCLRYIDGRTGEVKEDIQMVDGYAVMALSPDGSQLATFGRRSGRLDFFSTHPLKHLRFFEAAEFGQTGDLMFFSSGEPDLFSWRAAKNPGGLMIHTETGAFKVLRPGFVAQCDVPGRRSVIGTERGRVTLVQVDSAEIIWQARDPLERCKAIAISTDQKFVFAGSRVGLVEIYDMTNGRVLRSFTPHEGLLDEILAGRDPHQFVTVGDATKWKSVKLWGVQNIKNPIRRFSIKQPVNLDAQSDWDRRTGLFVAGLQNAAVYQFPSGSSKIVATFNRQQFVHQPTAMFLDETTLAGRDGDKGLSLFDLEKEGSESRLWTKPVYADLIRSYDRKMMITTRLYNSEANAKGGFFQVTKDGPVDLKLDRGYRNGCGISSDGRYLALGNSWEEHMFQRKSDGSWESFVLFTGGQQFPGMTVDHQLTAMLFPHADTPHYLVGYLATGSQRMFRLYDLERMETVWSKTEPHDSRAAMLDPTGKILITGSADGVLRGYVAMTLEPLFEKRVHDHDVSALAVRPDGGMIATGDSNGLIRIWSMQAERPGELVRELAGSGGVVESIDFSPSGQKLASISGGHIRVWDFQNLDFDPVANSPTKD